MTHTTIYFSKAYWFLKKTEIMLFAKKLICWSQQFSNWMNFSKIQREEKDFQSMQLALNSSKQPYFHLKRIGSAWKNLNKGPKNFEKIKKKFRKMRNFDILPDARFCAVIQCRSVSFWNCFCLYFETLACAWQNEPETIFQNQVDCEICTFNSLWLLTTQLGVKDLKSRPDCKYYKVAKFKSILKVHFQSSLNNVPRHILVTYKISNRAKPPKLATTTQNQPKPATITQKQPRQTKNSKCHPKLAKDVLN